MMMGPQPSNMFSLCAITGASSGISVFATGSGRIIHGDGLSPPLAMWTFELTARPATVPTWPQAAARADDAFDFFSTRPKPSSRRKELTDCHRCFYETPVLGFS